MPQLVRQHGLIYQLFVFLPELVVFFLQGGPELQGFREFLEFPDFPEISDFLGIWAVV